MNFLVTSLSFATMMAIPVLSAPLEQSTKTEREGFSGVYILDDYPGVDVTYSGTWTHLTDQGYQTYLTTQSYTSEANAEVRFDAPKADYGIDSVKIYSTKYSDRGPFNVYCGKSLVGTGDEWAAKGETDTTVVFDQAVTACDLPDGGAPYIVVKNDKGAENLAIDIVQIFYHGK